MLTALVLLLVSQAPVDGWRDVLPAGERGALPVEALREVQRHHRAAAASCFVEHRLDDALEGRFETEVLVSQHGPVLRAEPRQTPEEGLAVARCLARVARGWTFPLAESPTRGTLVWLVGGTPARAAAYGSDGVALTLLEAAEPLQPSSPFSRLVLSEVKRLSRCVPADGVPGPEGSLVSLLFWNQDGVPVQPRVLGEVTPVSSCLAQAVHGWRLPLGSPQRPGVTVLVRPDGKVEARRYVGADWPIAEAEVRAVLGGQREELRRCYEDRLTKVPTLQGELTPAFMVRPDGAVGDVEVELDTVGDEGLQWCVRRLLSRLRFPPPPGEDGVLVTYPFLFQLPPAQLVRKHGTDTRR